jgi:hypothetical protein
MGQRGIFFGKVNDVILHKKINIFKYFSFEAFWGLIQMYDFSWLVTWNFYKLLKSQLMLKKREQILLKQNKLPDAGLKIFNAIY